MSQRHTKRAMSTPQSRRCCPKAPSPTRGDPKVTNCTFAPWPPRSAAQSVARAAPREWPDTRKVVPEISTPFFSSNSNKRGRTPSYTVWNDVSTCAAALVPGAPRASRSMPRRTCTNSRIHFSKELSRSIAPPKTIVACGAPSTTPRFPMTRSSPTWNSMACWSSAVYSWYDALISLISSAMSLPTYSDAAR